MGFDSVRSLMIGELFIIYAVENNKKDYKRNKRCILAHHQKFLMTTFLTRSKSYVRSSWHPCDNII